MSPTFSTSRNWFSILAFVEIGMAVGPHLNWLGGFPCRRELCGFLGNISIGF